MKKVLGGNRLGSGNKMKVDLKSYERSTHNMGYIWRSTMSAGTLVPCLTEVALPGDTWDIDMDVDIKTHPTIGPLFGSFKVQVDVFVQPMRLYIGELNNNDYNVGLQMDQIRFPQIQLQAADIDFTKDPDNQQINPSCILSHLNIRGLGKADNAGDLVKRQFNAQPLIGYYDTVKNYYANKQEKIMAILHQGQKLKPVGLVVKFDDIVLPQVPASAGDIITYYTSAVVLEWTSGATPDLDEILINTVTLGQMSVGSMFKSWTQESPTRIVGRGNRYNDFRVMTWNYAVATDTVDAEPKVKTFPIDHIDLMRKQILAAPALGQPVLIEYFSGGILEPYNSLLDERTQGGVTTYSKMAAGEGLALKTYQNDMFNNWLDTETIMGNSGINAITKIDTTSGGFTIDTLNLATKVYEMMNRVAAGGGSYHDWIEVVYGVETTKRYQSPMYVGGLSKELVFQEVISNAAAGQEAGEQPLGTLGGRGVMSGKHKGGKVSIKVDEPSYIMAIISLTPRVDYSQGNKWDVNLKSLDDLHKPSLDGIGFQDLITDQMASWDTTVVAVGNIQYKSAGKQPAWINYMTNVNQVRGNFAISSNEMFMTLNRRYEMNQIGDIQDLTTYIDPVKCNHIFAETSRDAQNFWAQIGFDITTRRKMSAKVMPTL